MMKEITSVMILLALCIPALAVDMPNIVGNWTGSYEGPEINNSTGLNPAGNFSFYKIGDETWTLIIEKQNGTSFVGKRIIHQMTAPPRKLVGVIGFDNKTISMVDEHGYYWGEIISPTEMQLLRLRIGADRMSAMRMVLTKE